MLQTHVSGAAGEAARGVNLTCRGLPAVPLVRVAQDGGGLRCPPDFTVMATDTPGQAGKR